MPKKKEEDVKVIGKVQEIEEVVEKKEEEKKKEKQSEYISHIDVSQSEKTKSLIILVVFLFASIWIISLRGNVPQTETPFDKNNPIEGNDLEDNAEGVIAVYKYLEKLKTSNYEFLYTIEPDNEKEYFLLKGQIDEEEGLFYKEWQNKNYTYYKKASTYYIPGQNVWKKTKNGLSYEGYDTTLYNPTDLYNIIYNNESNVTTTDSGITKYIFKVDMNLLISAYNKYQEIDKTIPLLEPKTSYVEFTVYEDKDSKYNIEVEMKEYYELIYGKKYNSIFYSLEYSRVGSSSIDNVDSIINNN